MHFEYLYGSSSLVDEIYKASLCCLEPHLLGVMNEEFEKLKNEYKYVYYTFYSIPKGATVLLSFFFLSFFLGIINLKMEE